MAAHLIQLLALCSACSLAGIGRTVAVGDVHGDFRTFVTILRDAGLIDMEKNWSGGKAHLIQTGDILDRGPDSRLIMDLMMKLEQQAPLDEGRVHQLLGNHESMLLSGDVRYVTDEDAASYGGIHRMTEQLSIHGRYGKWLSRHQAVLVLNETLFIHAGLSEDYSNCRPEIINDMVRKAVLFPDPDGSPVRGSDGPLWFRGWASDRSSSVERTVTAALEAAGAERAAIGHTVSYDGVTTRFSGRVVMIDTGLSEHYGGPVQYIELDQRGFKVHAVQEGEEI